MAKVLNPLDILPYSPRTQKNRTEIISLVVGLLLFVLGLSGLPFSNFMGLHLSIFHCLIIAAAGIVLFWNGYLANHRGAFWACFGFGMFFGLHSLMGVMLGEEGVGAFENRPASIFMNFKELGTADYILDGILCVVLLLGAIDWSLQRRKAFKGR